MENKVFIFLVLFVFGIHHEAKSQDFESEYKALNGDWGSQEMSDLLDRWGNVEPENLDYLIARFNFYFVNSQEEMIAIEERPGPGENLVIQDSLGNDVGYMYDRKVFSDSLLNLAHTHIDKAIQNHPKRLDLWFGKIYVFGQSSQFDFQVEYIVKSIQKGMDINWNWLWAEDEPLEDPQDFFKASIQDYVTYFFDNDQDLAIKNVSQKMIEAFPEDEVSYTNLGIAQLFLNEEDSALATFKIANSLAPNDVIILFNMGYAQEVLELWEEALLTYQKILDIGEDYDIETAQEKIKALPIK